MPEPIGEIVETGTTELVAQACEVGRAPAFGSFVKVEYEAGEMFAVVFQVRTGGLEPGAQAIMRGRDGMRDEAIYRENPDLRAVLRTEFGGLIVGFREDGIVHQYLPPVPPALHWSVYECTEVEVATFTHELDYFRSVLAVSSVPAEELLAANLRLVRKARPFEPDFPVKAGRELARLLSRDYARLSAILRRVGC